MSTKKMAFKEIQKFNQWWLWLILFLCLVIPFVGMCYQYLSSNNLGNNLLADTGFLLIGFVMLLLVAIFLIMKLQTEVGYKGIKMQFFPFVKKEILWHEVKTAEVIDYGFVGGWGIRLWTKHGTVYNIRGNKGLAIKLKNGQKFLIGTQKEEDLKQILNQVW